MNSVHINDVLLTRDQVIFIKRSLLDQVVAFSPDIEQEETEHNRIIVLSKLEERFAAFNLLSMIDGQLDPTNVRYAYNGELSGKYLRIAISQHRIKFFYSKNIVNALVYCQHGLSRYAKASEGLCRKEITALYELVEAT